MIGLAVEKYVAGRVAAGEARGEARALVRTVRKLPAVRFGEIPETLVARLPGIQDVGRLDRLTDSILDAGSLEEFEALMPRH